jgi:hypothetical protein
LIRRCSQGARSFSVGALSLLPARFTFFDLPEVVRQISTSAGAPKAAYLACENLNPPSQNLCRGRRSTSIIDVAAENPARRQTGTFYILCLRDFEILGARDVKRDEHERLIFLAAYSASGHSSPWITADFPRKVSIAPPSLHESG